MNFEKKYWSEGEFDYNGEPYIGYVGIYDGNAYIYNTDEILTGNDSYLCRIHRSKEEYDRTLSHELRLPYGKNDILFAANDFLYNSTLKTAVERLEANNNYIFRNAIISNSNLPYTENCTVLASDGKEHGILKKYNFSEKAFANATSTDPIFYPQTELKDKYVAKNIIGLHTDEVSGETAFVNVEDEKRDTSKDKYPVTVGDTAETFWERLYPYGNEAAGIFQNGRLSDTNNIKEIARLAGEINQAGDIHYDLYVKEYFFSRLNGDYTYKPVEANVDTLIELNDNRIKNILLPLTDNPLETINFNLNILYFIIEEKSEDLEVSINGKKPIMTFYELGSKNGYLLKCDFRSLTSEGEPSNVESSIIPADAYSINENSYITFNVKFNKNVNIVNVNNIIACDFRYNIGNISTAINDYKNIPNVYRKQVYSYVWTADNFSKPVIAPNTYTYKYLRESVEWRKAVNPRLYEINVELGSNTYSSFIPGDDMTAGDTFAFMANNIYSYNKFPDVYKVTTFSFQGKSENYKYAEGDELQYITNSDYVTKVYNVNSYKLEDGKILKSYKLPADIYVDLDVEKINYDKIPVIEKTTYSSIKSEEQLLHNFNEITASNIVVKDIEVDEITKVKKLNLFIFIAFKTKLIIT